VTGTKLSHNGSGLNEKMVAAQWCAEQGCQVVPCQNRTKRPFVTWKLGTPQDRSTTDPEQIARWWQQWPDANPALMTGSRSGFFVLDVDGEKGRANLRKLFPHLYND
jgi:hypothetical protein